MVDITKENTEMLSSIENAITATREAESNTTRAAALKKDHREYYSKYGVSDFRSRVDGNREVDFFDMLDSVSDDSKIPVARTLLKQMRNKNRRVASTAQDGWAWANTWAWANVWVAVNGAIAANAGVAVNATIVGTKEVENYSSTTIDGTEIRLSDHYRDSETYSELSAKGYSEVRQEALLKGLISGRIPGAEITTADDGTIHVKSSYEDCGIAFDFAPSEDGKILQLL
ncbi:hypothetical protein [uncultured Bifidobacterium sp.]|uniref:hypothetical protein n=1 Tax=uncultured Bifidobacterium sp. TaxID=165187 RepID=UPI0025FE49AC|nr:hypothetical protein [uncultured Bifidobacterium sp.]